MSVAYITPATATPQEIEKTHSAAHISNQMDSIESTWYGTILAAILSILQLIYESGGEPQFHLQTTVSLFASLALIGLTSFNRLPCPKQFKIPLFFSILACGAFLSATVLRKLWLLPYLSCIRPLFDLLGDLYFLCRDFVISHLLEFYKRKLKKLTKQKIMEPNQLFLPSFNSEGFMRSDEVLQ